MVCPPVREIIHSLKLLDYHHVQAHEPWDNCNYPESNEIFQLSYYANTTTMKAELKITRSALRVHGFTIF